MIFTQLHSPSEMRLIEGWTLLGFCVISLLRLRGLCLRFGGVDRNLVFVGILGKLDEGPDASTDELIRISESVFTEVKRALDGSVDDHCRFA